MTKLDGIAQAADRLSDEIIALRRKIHEHPELAFEEHETATRVEEFLKRLGIPCRTGIGKTGIVALLEGGKPGPTIAIRADMDALPINEPAGLPFASKIPGKMHACGHDAHTAIVLGVAAVLSGMRDDIAGRVMFVFQPAEETLTGAARDARGRRVRGSRCPTPFVGFHNWPQLRTGTVGWHPGRGDGVVRRVRRDDQGHRRARRASASRRRFDRRRGAVRQSVADDRQPRDRADQLGRRDHRPHCRRDGAQHHRAVGRVERLGAHARIRDRRQGRGRRTSHPGRAQGRDARRLRAQMDEAHAGLAQRQADDGARAERRARNARSGQRHRNARAEHGQRGLRLVRRARAFGASADRLARSTATIPPSIAPTTS